MVVTVHTCRKCGYWPIRNDEDPVACVKCKESLSILSLDKPGDSVFSGRAYIGVKQ